MAKVKRKRKAIRDSYEIPAAEAEQIIKNAFENGVLLWIDGGAWGNRKSIEDSMLVEAKLPPDAVRATQNLVKKERVREVTTWIQRAHTWARRNSLPWVTRSVHFIPKNKIDEGVEFLEGCIKNMKEALETFIEDEYDALREEFKNNYPKLYRSEYYPSKEQLRQKFRLRYGFNVITLPSGDGKVTVLSKEQMEMENQKFKEMLRQTFEESVQLIRKSFLRMVDYLREVLQDPNKRFAESTVENPKKFLENFFENMDIYGDKPFSATAKKIKDLLDGVYAEDLRDDEEYRKVMGNALDKMVGDLRMLPTIKMQRDIDI